MGQAARSGMTKVERIRLTRAAEAAKGSAMQRTDTLLRALADLVTGIHLRIRELERRVAKLERRL